MTAVTFLLSLAITLAVAGSSSGVAEEPQLPAKEREVSAAFREAYQELQSHPNSPNRWQEARDILAPAFRSQNSEIMDNIKTNARKMTRSSVLAVKLPKRLHYQMPPEDIEPIMDPDSIPREITFPQTKKTKGK